MPDIIERLATCSRKLLDAGAEIARLRAENERLMAAVEVDRIAELLSRFPVRCHDNQELDELRRREAARAIVEQTTEKKP